MSDDGLRARIVAEVGAFRLQLELDSGPGPLVVLGPNGAGKSLLLLVLLGAVPVSTGSIALGDRTLLDTARGIDVPLEERRLGYVPQDYALFPHLSVRGNVSFAWRSAHGRASTAEEARAIDDVLARLELEALAERKPSELSGGERQRVALARALVVSPHALLLDEPLAALDAQARRKIRAHLLKTLAELSLPSLVVTHDAEDARAFGQRIVVLESGRVTQTGSWSELQQQPATEFVRSMTAAPLEGAQDANPLES